MFNSSVSSTHLVHSRSSINMMQSSEGGSRAGWSRGVWREATPPSGETNAPEIPRQCLGQATSHLMESGSDSKECACNAGDPSSIPGSGRSPGEGNSYPLQCSCLENPMGRGAWWAIVHGVAKNQTWLSNFHSVIHKT